MTIDIITFMDIDTVILTMGCYVEPGSICVCSNISTVSSRCLFKIITILSNLTVNVVSYMLAVVWEAASLPLFKIITILSVPTISAVVSGAAFLS